MIVSHVYSHLLYGLPVWGNNISVLDVSKLNGVIYKVLRLHCGVPKRGTHNIDLCNATGLRNFSSLRIIADACLLHTVCTQPSSTPIMLRLLQQSYTVNRIENRVFFFDYSVKKVGRTSFFNRAKRISELIPFPWANVSKHLFKFKMKICTPRLIR